MRPRLALLVLLVLALGACAADPSQGPGAGASGGPATSAAPGPTTAPSSTAKPEQTRQRPVPRGVAALADRRQAPALRVSAFDGRTVTLGAFRGRPVVVNFFESW